MLRLKYGEISMRFLPLIKAVCETQRMTPIIYYNDYIFISELRKLAYLSTQPPFNVNLFETICTANLSTIQKIIVPAEFYFNQNSHCYNLRSLHLRVSDGHLVSYLCHPACKAEELIIELVEIDGLEIEWGLTRHIMSANK